MKNESERKYREDVKLFLRQYNIHNYFTKNQLFDVVDNINDYYVKKVSTVLKKLYDENFVIADEETKKGIKLAMEELDKELKA